MQFALFGQDLCLLEKYVEIIACLPLSETTALSQSNYKALTEIGIIAHMRLSSLPYITGGLEWPA